MIFPKADVMLFKDKDGNIFFHSKDVDLDKKSLSVPIELEGGLGTIEFKRTIVIVHPPNGKRKFISAEEFKKLLEEDFEGFNLE